VGATRAASLHPSNWGFSPCSVATSWNVPWVGGLGAVGAAAGVKSPPVDAEALRPTVTMRSDHGWCPTCPAVGEPQRGVCGGGCRIAAGVDCGSAVQPGGGGGGGGGALGSKGEQQLTGRFSRGGECVVNGAGALAGPCTERVLAAGKRAGRQAESMSYLGWSLLAVGERMWG
jgi:hypothetical protein